MKVNVTVQAPFSLVELYIKHRCLYNKKDNKRIGLTADNPNINNMMWWVQKISDTSRNERFAARKKETQLQCVVVLVVYTI
jgi:hypothetical protein